MTLQAMTLQAKSNETLIEILADGNDIKSLGRSAEVLELIGDDESRFSDVFAGIFHKNPVIRLRAIDTVEKAVHKHPGWIRKRKKKILSRLDEFAGHDVQQMHIALMADRMNLTFEEGKLLFKYLKQWAKKDQKWIRVSCASGAGAIAVEHPELKRQVVSFLNKLKETDGSKSVVKRCEMVLKKFG